MKKKDVLDGVGFVRLVDSMGSDLSIVRAARVSYDAAWRAGENTGSDANLISYLMKNGHNTPFEAVEFQFEVMAPIFVVRQWHRHRTWSFNELSARYRELPERYYLPKYWLIGKQSASSKQARVVSGEMGFWEKCKRRAQVDIVDGWCRGAFRLYRFLLWAGWPRELARMVLPLNTYTHMFAKVDLHNLMKFLDERDHPHAQYEIGEYARAIKELIKPAVPVTMKAFDMRGSVN